MADPDNSALDDARKRARRRLMGAVVLALAAAVTLPMFLESDPRPLGPEVQIQIPAIDDAKFQNRLTPVGETKAPAADKAVPSLPPAPAKAPRDATTAAAPAVTNTAAANKTEPAATVPAPPLASKPGESASASPSVAATPPSATAQKTPAAPTNPDGATSSSGPSSAATKPATAPAKKSAAPVATPAPASAAALPASSLTTTVPPLGATPTPNPAPVPPAAPAAAQGAFVVQLGAFVDSAVAKDLAAKAGEQGFTAFLEAVTTKSGQVQRVRVGPFATRGEADAAAGKLKAAGFTAVARPR
ncbi:MAG: SPOR domain-containing protein [Acidobacteriota bacterium]